MLLMLAEATGLHTETIYLWLRNLVVRAGYNPETVTLDEVREILADTLQDLLLEHREL